MRPYFWLVFGVSFLITCSTSPPQKKSTTSRNPYWWQDLALPHSYISFLPTPCSTWQDTSRFTPRGFLFSYFPFSPGPPLPVLDSGPLLIELFAPDSIHRPALAEIRITRIIPAMRPCFQYTYISRCTTNIPIPDWDTINTIWARWSSLKHKGYFPPYTSKSDTGWLIVPLDRFSRLFTKRLRYL